MWEAAEPEFNVIVSNSVKQGIHSITKIYLQILHLDLMDSCCTLDELVHRTAPPAPIPQFRL